VVARGGDQEGQCRECCLEDRIRALEQKAVGWQVDGEVSEEEGAVRRQFGGLMVGIEDRIAKAKRELAEIEIRVEGALSRCGSMGGELQKMLKEQGEIKSALASLEIELGLEEGEADGMMAEWITVGRKGKQQQQRERLDPPAGRTAGKEAGGKGRKERADKPMAGVAAIPQTQEIVVIGDSIARDVGARIQEQHGVVKVFAKGGGTLADAQRKVEEITLTGEEAVVIMTGGNDIDRGDGTEEVVRGYERLVASLRSKGVERITLVGPSIRRHFSGYFKSKVIGMNERLERWCEREGMNFVEGGVTELDKIRLLARDGVHFSRSGEDLMVRKIYQSTRQYLNGVRTKGTEVE
jgi:hypothetical protein